MKKILVFLLFCCSFGTAHAENVYEMNLYAQFLNELEGVPTPIPISAISKFGLTFSGDVLFQESTDICCYLDLGNNGSFTVKFDRPVKTAGLDILLLPDNEYPIIGLSESQITATYLDGEGNFLGQTSIAANWLPPTSQNGDYWQWNNTYNGRSGAFGVSNSSGFSEITFSVDAGIAIHSYRSDFALATQLSSFALYYDYVNPPPVPEPQTYALMLAGLGVIGTFARRRARTRRIGN